MKTIVLVLLLSAPVWAGVQTNWIQPLPMVQGPASITAGKPAGIPGPTWVFSSSGNLAQMTQPIPKGYGYPRGSILSMSLAGEEVIGTLTGKNGKTLCTLQGVYTDCSIIDGCGTIGPALSTCGK